MTSAAEVTAAPYFSLVRAAWVSCAVTWDPDSGEFRRAEGLRGFESYRQALQASRFLARLNHWD